jgi:hypothetical protein
MKYYVFILAAMLYSCGQYLPYSADKEVNDTVLITVECKNEKRVETSVVQALKFVRINDLEKEDNGLTLFIKARYQELPDHRAMQIKADLQHILGVFDIQITKDGMPVKNIIRLNPISP